MGLKSRTEELLDAGADYALGVAEDARTVATDARDWIRDNRLRAFAYFTVAAVLVVAIAT